MMIEDDNDGGILISTLEVIYMLLICELLRKSFGLLNLVIYAEKRFPQKCSCVLWKLDFLSYGYFLGQDDDVKKKPRIRDEEI